MRIVYLLSLFLVVCLLPCSYVNGEENGKGAAQATITKTLPNGAVYVGQMKNDKFDGQGTMTFPDGAKYVGAFAGGKPNGQGTMDFPDKRKYVGEWKNGLFDGKGNLELPDGSRYVGQFVADKPNGEGVWTYADGSEDTGTFKDGKLFNGKHSSKAPPEVIAGAEEGTRGKIVIKIKDGKPVEKRTITSSPGFDDRFYEEQEKAREKNEQYRQRTIGEKRR